MKKVVIASTNKTKITAVKQAFGLMFPLEEFEFKESGVKATVCDPTTNKETFTGALCRVEEASKSEDASYWVGIESGTDQRDGECAVFSWVVIKSNDGKIGKARSATFYMPDKIFKAMKEDRKLDDSDSLEETALHGGDNGHKHGTVGVLTDNLIDRVKYYVDPIILALIPFRNPELY